eukprot:gene14920-biopygen7893
MHTSSETGGVMNGSERKASSSLAVEMTGSSSAGELVRAWAGALQLGGALDTEAAVRLASARWESQASRNRAETAGECSRSAAGRCERQDGQESVSGRCILTLVSLTVQLHDQRSSGAAKLRLPCPHSGHARASGWLMAVQCSHSQAGIHAEVSRVRAQEGRDCRGRLGEAAVFFPLPVACLGRLRDSLLGEGER